MQTATNPQTGEKVQWNGTAWVPLSAPAAPAPAAPVTLGTPKPRKPEIRQVGSQLGIVGDDGSFTPTYTPPEKPATAPGDGKVTGDERKASFLGTNLTGNVAILNRALGQDPKSARPTWGQKLWSFAGQDVKNSMLPEQRQVIEDSQLAILDAALTLGTGAAYTKEQLEGYRQSYFPQLGDKPAAIAAKRERLKLAMLAAKQAAGTAAPQIDEAIQQLGLDGELQTDPVLTSGANLAPETGDEIKGRRLTAAQQQEWGNFIAGKPDAAAINKWWEDHGYPGLSNAEEVAKALREGKPVDVGIDYSKVDESAETRAREEIARENKLRSPDSNAKVLVNQGATLALSDEAAGVGNALGYAVTGRNPVEGYRLGRDAERLRIQDAREQLGYGGTALEVVGGFLSANPQSVIAPALSRAQTVAQGARAGAIGGGIAGWGSGEGTEDSVAKGIVGSVLGAGIGAGVSGVSTALTARGRAPDLARAAQAEGVDLRRPMFDPNAANKLSALEAAPGSAPLVQRSLQQTSDQIEAGVGRLGAGGQILDTEAAGDRVQGAARRFINRSRGVANRLYDRARNLAGDQRVQPTEALTQVDRELADLAQNPETNAGEIRFLEGLRADLAEGGGKSVEALRSLRTSIRGRVNEQNLTATQAEARAHRVLDAVHQDLRTLPNGAATAFRRADTYYRERMTHIDDVLGRFLGRQDSPMSSEQAFTRLKSLASPGGDGRRLAAMMRNLEPQEQQDVAATIAQSLGRRDPDGPFSTRLFVSQAIKLSPSARRTIFGPSGAESIQRLITLSRALEQGTSRLNRSNSARSLMQDTGRSLVASLIGVPVGTVSGSATAGGVAAAAPIVLGFTRAGLRNLSARALMSPRVSNWLAQAANVNTPAQAQQAARRLGTIISREPALAGELQPLQSWLSEAVRPAAASDREEKADD